MSIASPTPRDTRQTASLRFLLRRLTTLGWRVELAPSPSSRRPSYALLARGTDRRGADAKMVLHVFEGVTEIRLDDLWRLVAQMNEVQGDLAALCVPAIANVSELARSTAAQLGVEIVIWNE